MKNVYFILQERGFIENFTNEEKVIELLEKPQVCYTGFDPTGDSLHVGHLLPIMALMHLEKAGHKPIVLLGGGTAMIGDPSGKTEMRKMISKEQIEENKKRLKKQFSKYLDIENKTKVMDNAEWLLPLNYIDFLREIGVHFSVNRMIAAEAYKQRLERGLSFIEFNYQILQAYDFLTLFRKEKCMLQMGGNDQWGNILAGEDLIRRVEGKEVHAFTYPLLTTAEGKKMGKTEKGAVWLDKNKLAPFDYFQFWRNVDDRDVIKLLKLFTFLPLDEIEKLEKSDDINKAKEVLAFEATKITHGEEEAKKALETAKSMFSGKLVSVDAIPSTEIRYSELEGKELTELMVIANLTSSKGEAKRLIKQGGVSVNGNKISDFKYLVNENDVVDGMVIIRIGKKKYHKFIVK